MPDENVRRLPSFNEFSPRTEAGRGIVDLGDVLTIVADHAGDAAAIVEAIRSKYFATSAAKRTDPAERLEQQVARAENVLIGMKTTGLYDETGKRLTEVGETVRAAGDEQAQAEAFASHILRQLHGIEIVETIRSLQARGDRITKQSLATELNSRGFRTSQGMPVTGVTTNHTKLLNWLAIAGVFRDGRELDEEKFRRLAGLSLDDLDEIQRLSKAQKAFLGTLRQLATVHGKSPIQAKDVAEQCVFQNGQICRPDAFAAKIYRPLQESGWIEWSGGGGRGRGGKSGTVAATDKLVEVEPARLEVESSDEIPSDVRDKLSTPLTQVYVDLESPDTHVKGLALEVLAVRLAHEVGLTPLRFRERGQDTQGAEVDLIAEGIHLHFSRWLFQCKNTGTVALSALAKEIGMAVLLKAHVIVIATTGRFARSVIDFANGLAQTTALQVVLIDGVTLARYRTQGTGYIVDHFRNSASATMRLKRNQINSAAE